MGQNPTPIVYTNDLNPGTKPVSKAKQGHTNNPQVNNNTKKDLLHTNNNPHAVAAHTSEVPNSTKDTTLSDRVEMIAQTSQGDGTSTTPSRPTPKIGPNISHTLSENNKNKDTSQYTFNQSHRDTAVISKHDHDVKGTLQPRIPPQKTTPTPNKTQETGREYIARPTTLTVDRINSPGVDTGNNNSQPETPAKHHTILTPQQKNKQKTPASSRPTH